MPKVKEPSLLGYLFHLWEKKIPIPAFLKVICATLNATSSPEFERADIRHTKHTSRKNYHVSKNEMIMLLLLTITRNCKKKNTR